MGDDLFRFDDLELDAARYQLTRAGERIAIEPRVFDLLTHLVRNRERVVPKEELLDSVWGTRFVSEAALTTALRAARRAVGDTGSDQRVIRTAHGRGYRFVADVTQPSGGAPPLPAPDAPAQEIRFCRAVDVAAIAPRVTCPTLILHSRDDVRVPAEFASELASLIPNSSLVLLDSASHLLGASEPAWEEFLRHVDEFLAT